MGTLRPLVHSCVASPQVAKCSDLAAWLSPATMCLLTIVSAGTSLHSPAASHSLIVLSSAQVRSWRPAGVYATPRTTPECACHAATHFLSVRFHTRSSPSAAAEARVERLEGCLARQVRPSLWPSRLPRNGLANTRSSLTALRARWYSRSASKGCSAGLGVRARVRRERVLRERLRGSRGTKRIRAVREAIPLKNVAQI